MFVSTYIHSFIHSITFKHLFRDMLSISWAGKESTCNAGDPGSSPGSGRSTGEGIGYPLQYCWASLVAQLVKNLSAMWAIPGLGRSPGERKGYARQDSGLENSMDCIDHGITKSWTWLSNFHIMELIKTSLGIRSTFWQSGLVNFEWSNSGKQIAFGVLYGIKMLIELISL